MNKYVLSAHIYSLSPFIFNLSLIIPCSLRW